jgi:hypothetical protein
VCPVQQPVSEDLSEPGAAADETGL